MERLPRWIVFGLLFLISIVNGQHRESEEFKITKFEVPSFVNAGDDVVLECSYKNKSRSPSEPWKISWLINNTNKFDEFYAYFPHQIEAERQKVFDQHEGFGKGKFEVDLESSSSSRLVLKDLKLGASHIYRCKVTSPSRYLFNTAYGDGYMEVGVIPKEKPRIVGIPKNVSKVGDYIALNCTSAPSIPPAKLTWFINDNKAPNSMVKEYMPKITENHLFVTTFGLNFNLQKRHSKDGQVKFKCTAEIDLPSKTHKLFEEHIHKSDATRNSLRYGALALILVSAHFLR